MSTPNTRNIEKRRGRPRGSTNGPAKRNDSFNKPTVPYNPCEDCLCALSGLPLPATGHLDSCTRAVGYAVKGDPGTRTVIIDLEDDDTDGTDGTNGHLQLPAFSKHGRLLKEAHLRTLRETSSNTPRPAKRRRKKATYSYNLGSVASDILRAAGIHPTLPPLNWHLLQKT